MFKQLATIWQELGIAQRVTLGAVALLFTAIIAAIGFGASQPDYALLASQLSQAETARIASYLQGQNVPYRLADNDTAVLVPRADRYRLLNELSQQELLTDGSRGFELLDAMEMGSSVFRERKTYDRAIAGELERIIKEIDGVSGARVIVQRGAESPFLMDAAKPSAAVKLSMETGRRLSKKQLAGVVHLVSGAVGELGHDRVQVMDDQGLLTGSAEGAEGMADASAPIEAEQALEKHLAQKAQAILDKVLGPGRSLVSLSVDLDFSRRSEASSEPVAPVVIETQTRESAESTPVAGNQGLAGTASNIELAQAQQPKADPATRSTSEETKRWVTGKKTVTLEDEVGRIRGMGVSILLDHQRTETPGAEGKEPVVGWTEYAKDERDRFQQLVLDAIGYPAALGAQKSRDPKGNAAERFTVNVQSMRMHEPPAEPVVAAPALDPAAIENYLRYGAVALVLLGLLLIARGQLKRGHATATAEQARRKAEADRLAVEQGRVQAGGRDADLGRQLKQQVQDRIGKDPAAAAAILKGWMHGG